MGKLNTLDRRVNDQPELGGKLVPPPGLEPGQAV